MDRSLGTVAQPRIQNVTDQILKSHVVYGASDNTNPSYSASNRSLNYAEGGSITRPQQERVSILPFTLRYQDSVGLFGKENHFIKVNIDIDGTVALACYEEEGWNCVSLTEESQASMGSYTEAVIDQTNPDSADPTYEPARLVQNFLLSLPDAYVSVDLKNLKTGNKYLDSWLDVRLYTKNRKEHPYDRMYVRIRDYFYIGFHARNTKRLPYNVECEIGQEYLSGVPAESARYINN